MCQGKKGLIKLQYPEAPVFGSTVKWVVKNTVGESCEQLVEARKSAGQLAKALPLLPIILRKTKKS